jgi:signal transduction histidine kinase
MPIEMLRVFLGCSSDVRGYESTGIGLALVRKAIHRMDGKVVQPGNSGVIPGRQSGQR